jgi:hypothetical protein
MAFPLNVRLWNLLLIVRLEGNDDSLYPIHAGTRHIDDVFIEANFCFIEFQLFLKSG